MKGPWIMLSETQSDKGFFLTDSKGAEKNVGKVSGEGDGQRTLREKAKCYLLHPELRERHFLLELEWQ